ncbi:MAG: undecaprenyl-phosphate galactose phosphotransferase WbaP [Acidobacteriaceae bacterium]|nr:undecaprenyl-phosphate galactose phosphotransferase WbaP [Acidobacteriaceae bacterium]
MATTIQQYPSRSIAISVTPSVCKPWVCTLLIMAGDVLVSAFVVALSVFVRHAFNGNYTFSIYWRLWPLLSLFVAVYAVSGLYPGIVFNTITEIKRVVVSINMVFLIFAVLAFLLRVSDTYSRLLFFMAWIALMITAPLARVAIRKIFAWREWWGYPTLVFGSGDTARRLVSTLKKQPELGFRVKVILDNHPIEFGSLYGIPAYEGLENAARITAESNISHLIVAKPEAQRKELLQLLECHGSWCSHLFIVPDLHGVSSLSIQVHDICRELTLEVRRNLLMPGPRMAKRLLDISLAIVIAMALLPFLLLIWVLLKLESPGPAFYAQSRIGRCGREFRIWKFRTMIPNADRVLSEYLSRNPELRSEWEQERKLRHDPRITPMGAFLRRTSLDELPQIWNVMKGEMSLVGPRPIVHEEMFKYGDEFKLYEQVLPGMTGLWQISGRNDLPYAERVALDSYYVRNWSPWFDIYVLGRTIKVVLDGAGAY